MPEEKKNKFCSNCGAEIDIKAKICPKCGVEQPLIPEKVSNWWYILAIFLGIVGGIIAWAVNKDRNPKKAIHFLIVGLIIPAIYIIGILASIVLVSLGGARGKARDAMRQADMRQVATAQEIYYYDGEKKYVTNVAKTDGTPAIGTYLDALIDPQGATKGYNWLANTTCDQKFCAYATLENKGTCATTRYFAASEKGTKELCTAPTDGCACF